MRNWQRRFCYAVPSARLDRGDILQFPHERITHPDCFLSQRKIDKHAGSHLHHCDDLIIPRRIACGTSQSLLQSPRGRVCIGCDVDSRRRRGGTQYLERTRCGQNLKPNQIKYGCQTKPGQTKQNKNNPQTISKTTGEYSSPYPRVNLVGRICHMTSPSSASTAEAKQAEGGGTSYISRSITHGAVRAKAAR